jgi:hypothetical protein
MFFWGKMAVRVGMPGLPVTFPIEIPWKSNANSPYENTQKCQPILSWVKAVVFLKDNWKGFEKDIQNSVDEGDVKVH